MVGGQAVNLTIGQPQVVPSIIELKGQGDHVGLTKGKIERYQWLLGWGGGRIFLNPTPPPPQTLGGRPEVIWRMFMVMGQREKGRNSSRSILDLANTEFKLALH
ncbi:hypothetical protein Ocin01_19723 [Orchesella cincta]|uniref:Uncharacterized protein n=1 Tax=Orchesella cincta TaxID=48709 RepID=A0A1D2M1W6_ORCCI|nr:hypothetical protein Ocin01_19723 [Orchesella cincta]